MNVVYLKDVPLAVRLEAARQLSILGEDVAAIFDVAVNPGDVSVVVDGEIEFVEEFCQRGHPWTPENTYVKKTDGKRRCRACMEMHNRARSQEYRKKVRSKVPCAYCGELVNRDNRRLHPVPRCRKCFLEQRRAA